jgi:hypothetical protein
MTLFSILSSLGLTATVHPMLNPGDCHLNAIDEYRARESGENEDEVYRIGEGFRKTVLVNDGGYEDMGGKEEEEVCHLSFLLQYIHLYIPFLLFNSRLQRKRTTRLTFEQIIQQNFPYTLRGNITWLNSADNMGRSHHSLDLWKRSQAWHYSCQSDRDSRAWRTT